MDHSKGMGSYIPRDLRWSVYKNIRDLSAREICLSPPPFIYLFIQTMGVY